ncbi:hypothetical protein DYB25_008448 [Aphanomyces astaci]|uniref:DNA recombination and repair protein Rad51-like C-terminal domain-containing protein n=1 Tax=Aphanomyces astaci TaxID=112090 RepID=A0A397ADN1_APHAT|nr:hypothetical protein DYB25_008448 [Aphanomyces astaci]RHY08268.1 hypothetical protein DYB36_001555 [Aphanomyces astaci]RHY54574.1 hypothetical protein DYB38_000158 [Aphanomyces astaci]RHY62165.1 hypothetical protein DYB30_001540 [Aphanomyces astaci]
MAGTQALGMLSIAPSILGKSMDRTSTEDTEGSFLVPRIVSLAQSMAIARRDDVPTGTPPLVRLVLLDSAAFHCRHAFDEMQGRARALHNMTVVLRKLVCEFPIAVTPPASYCDSLASHHRSF